MHQLASISRKAAACVLAGLMLGAPACAARRPPGTPGPEAEALAHAMQEAVNHSAWERTRALSWSFRGNRHHLWDRDRGLARVRWDDLEVLVDLESRAGLVTRDGRRLTGDKADKLVAKGFAYWTNDAFWLNPVAKLFDPGTERGLVELDGGGRGLLVEYTSGGLTPGDAYLWIPGPGGLPRSWRMWTSKLPRGGMRASWERWVTLATGARVATFHDLAVGAIEIGDVAGATALAELEPGSDPFAPLVAGLAGGGER